MVKKEILFVFVGGGLMFIVMEAGKENEEEEEKSEESGGGRVRGGCFWKSIIIFSKAPSYTSAYSIWHRHTSELGFNRWPHWHLLGGPAMIRTGLCKYPQIIILREFSFFAT